MFSISAQSLRILSLSIACDGEGTARRGGPAGEARLLGRKIKENQFAKKPFIFTPQKTNKMVAFPLSILALAAGVYLLIKVKKEYLNGFFSVLAWLVIVLSLLSIGLGAARGIHHFRHGGFREGHREVREEVMICPNGADSTCVYKNIKIGETDCTKMHGMGGCKMEGMECCKMGGMDCCKKEGAECCKMGGKEGCKMEGMGGCKMGGKMEGMGACPMMKGDSAKACCKKK